MSDLVQDISSEEFTKLNTERLEAIQGAESLESPERVLVLKGR
jgi:hypothetical protein